MSDPNRKELQILPVHVSGLRADKASVDLYRFRPQSRGTVSPTQSAVPFLSPHSVSGLTLVELDSPPAAPLVGVSAAWLKLVTKAEMTAPHLQVATFEGEQGTGKQTLARYLHSRSPLATSSFQRRDAREWLASDADPATLAGYIFLDRVDLLALPGQGLLLGVLKSLQDRPAGRAVVLASSQVSLRHMAAQGLLLPDLAFRLTAVRFVIPALRERKEDIVALAQCLLDRLCSRYQRRPAVLGAGALARLLQHHWPGNVRELAAVLEAALLDADGGVIRATDLSLTTALETKPNLQPAMSVDGLSLDGVIRQHVHHVLDLNRGNKLRAARQLAISRSTLYRILSNESTLTH